MDLAIRLNPRVKAEVSAVLNPDGLQLLSESRKKTGKEEKLWGARLGGLGTLFWATKTCSNGDGKVSKTRRRISSTMLPPFPKETIPENLPVGLDINPEEKSRIRALLMPHLRHCANAIFSASYVAKEKAPTGKSSDSGTEDFARLFLMGTPCTQSITAGRLSKQALAKMETESLEERGIFKVPNMAAQLVAISGDIDSVLTEKKTANSQNFKCIAMISGTGSDRIQMTVNEGSIFELNESGFQPMPSSPTAKPKETGCRAVPPNFGEVYLDNSDKVFLRAKGEGAFKEVGQLNRPFSNSKNDPRVFWTSKNAIILQGARFLEVIRKGKLESHSEKINVADNPKLVTRE